MFIIRKDGISVYTAFLKDEIKHLQLYQESDGEVKKERYLWEGSSQKDFTEMRDALELEVICKSSLGYTRSMIFRNSLAKIWIVQMKNQDDI